MRGTYFYLYMWKKFKCIVICQRNCYRLGSKKWYSTILQCKKVPMEIFKSWKCRTAIKQIFLYFNLCLSALRGVHDTTWCDKVCQWLNAGMWFSPGTSVSSTNKLTAMIELKYCCKFNLKYLLFFFFIFNKKRALILIFFVFTYNQKWHLYFILVFIILWFFFSTLDCSLLEY